MSARGFFTTLPRFGLPHPPIPLRVIVVTHLAVIKAFQILRAEGFPLASAKEDEITRELQLVMENRLLRSKEVRGFDIRRIRNVIRAPEISNFDNRHPAKRPDLVLFLLRREHMPVLHSQDAIFAECKPVDEDHSVGTHYCDKGIRRFVDGDYAWAMQEGMVVAFVRGGRTIAKDLVSILSSESRRAELGNSGPPVVVRPRDDGEALQSTLHQRSFAWPAEARRACAIRIFHSWHDCS